MNALPSLRHAALAAVLALTVLATAIPAAAATHRITVTPARPSVGKTVTIGVRFKAAPHGVTKRTPLYVRITTPTGGVIRSPLTHGKGLRWKGLIAFAVKGTWKLRIVTAKSPKALASASVRVRSS
jgi:hypothetical protein